MTLKTLLTTEYLMRAGNGYTVRKPSVREALELQRWHLVNLYHGNGNTAKRRAGAALTFIAPWLRNAYYGADKTPTPRAMPPHVFTANLPVNPRLDDGEIGALTRVSIEELA